MKKPNPAILAACTGPVAIFADFDGTLVEIAPRPDAIEVPHALPGQLDRLNAALDGALAIVTGRTIADIDAFLNSPKIAIAGSHGAELRQDERTAGPDADLRAAAADIAERLKAGIGAHDGILVEAKPAGVAVHFRAAPEKQAEVREAINAAVEDHDAFHIVAGKKVFEARPRTANKGKAVETLAAQAPFAGRMPIFIGDDVTDEDGFHAAHELGGFGIKVGPGQTSARFRIDEVSDVYALFDALVENQGEPPSSRRESASFRENMVK